ncbi:MAG: SH3 domain-containing protein, partial [Chloroflexota bacterium]|nr:SH3 domain-containing protein [Chloroflexota bacterium]
GEPISMGEARVQARSVSSGAVAVLSKVQGMSTGARLGIMVAVVLIFILIGYAGFSWVGRDKTEEVEATEIAESPLQSQLQATPFGGVILNETDPAKKASDPASIQIGSTSFVLGRGEIDDGAWKPIQAEWLEDTQVRRVVAVPVSMLENQIALDDILRIRIRSGVSIPYRVVEITEVQRTQIEVLSSLEPSLVVILFDDTAASSRQVVIARLDEQEMGVAPESHAYLINSPAGEANLRESPFGSIVGVLKNGTVVEVQTDIEPINDGGYKWMRIQTSYGAEGWIASQLLAEIDM